MSEQEHISDWFLARDGQQHGPLTDVEIRKIAELGHLRATDLVWRQGFENWVPAASAFPPPASVAAPPRPQPPPAPQTRVAAPSPTLEPEHRAAPRPGDPRPSAARTGADTSTAETDPHLRARAAAISPGYAPGPQTNAAATMHTAGAHGPRPTHHAPGALEPRQRLGHPDQIASGPSMSPAAQHAAYAPRAYEPPQSRDHRPGPSGSHDEAERYELEDGGDTRPRGFPWLRVAVVMICAMAIGAVAAFYFKGAVSLSALTQLVASAPADPAAGPQVVRAPRDDARVAFSSSAPGAIEANPIVTASSSTVPQQPVETPPPALSPPISLSPPSPPASAAVSPAPVVPAAKPAPLSFGSTAAEVDAALQKTTLWPVLKREFATWYANQVNDIIRAKSQRKDDATIANDLALSVAKLRRDNADAALSASPVRLQAVAATFVDNLDRLAKHSTEACYGYISAGEADPLIAELMRNSALSTPLQAQLVAIFEAIADGRRAPRKQTPAQTADFDVLATHLGKRGWSPLDLQLFSDPRALSRAAPVRVCKMVRDWFSAQIDITDEAVQLRLLVETLKPVVSG